MAVLIENTSIEPFTLPWPLLGVLAGRQRIVLNTTVQVVLTAFGGEGRLAGVRVSEVGAQAAYDFGIGEVSAPAGSAIGRLWSAGAGAPTALSRQEQGENLRQSKVLTITFVPSGTPQVLDIPDGVTTVLLRPSVDGDVLINQIRMADGAGGFGSDAANLGAEVQIVKHEFFGRVRFQDANINSNSIWTPNGDVFLTYFNDSVTFRNVLGGNGGNNRQRWRPWMRSVGPNTVGGLIGGAAVKVTKFITLTSGGATGTLDDVAVWDPAGTPADPIPSNIRVLSARLRVTAPQAVTVAALRTGTAGGGVVVLPDVATPTQTFDTSTAGPKEDNAGASPQLNAGTGLWLRRDRAITGDLQVEYVRL